MKRNGLLLLAIGTLMCAMGVAAYDTCGQSEGEQKGYIEQVGADGYINWSTGEIEAVGIGGPPEKFTGKPQARPMAIRAAQLDAYRNLLEITKGVRVDSATIVKDYTVESDTIRTQVEGIVRGARIVKTEYLSDGTVEVTLKMAFRDGLSQVVMNNMADKKEKAEPSPVSQTAPQARAATSEPSTAKQASPPPPVAYTGLVVDARGLGARPAMSPKLINEDGKEMYGTQNVDREYAVQQGISGYAKELSAAQTNPRVTNDPVTVKAIKTDGPGKSNIVISNKDIARIFAVSDTPDFIKKCRVMIVLD
ncbi:MAG: LPP20 family lipoprotein [Deltaproteobacteria bacterium]|nr:LPP20 family lipoprotein [Deltaproteobacteria bacterium]